MPFGILSRKRSLQSIEIIEKIRDKIYPYDILEVTTDVFMFRRPEVYNGTAPALIERGFSLIEYKRIKSHKEAVVEVKRIIEELKELDKQ